MLGTETNGGFLKLQKLSLKGNGYNPTAEESVIKTMISQHQSNSLYSKYQEFFYNIFISLYPEATQGNDLNLTM